MFNILKKTFFLLNLFILLLKYLTIFVLNNLCTLHKHITQTQTQTKLEARSRPFLSLVTLRSTSSTNDTHTAHGTH